jgi:membrane fusion protein (multidrug efflux system)
VVASVNVVETQRVPVGYPLVQLERADAYLNLQRAEAELLQIIRQNKGLLASDAIYAAQLSQRATDLEKAKEYAQRRDPLQSVGAVSAEAARDAQIAVRSAEAALAAARGELKAHRALIGGSLTSLPAVSAAAARVAEAFVALERTVIRAPVAGVVARRVVHVGARVNAGDRLLVLVPLEDVWVDANFKENQLAALRTGQPVRLIADVFGEAVPYSGTVAGFSPGTGSSFALLPPQNATGNWIKIVQRVPVRITLAPQDLTAHPLVVGLSMRVSVDTSDRTGLALTSPVLAAEHSELPSKLIEQAYQHVGTVMAKAL